SSRSSPTWRSLTQGHTDPGRGRTKPAPAELSHPVGRVRLATEDIDVCALARLGVVARAQGRPRYLHQRVAPQPRLRAVANDDRRAPAAYLEQRGEVEREALDMAGVADALGFAVAKIDRSGDPPGRKGVAAGQDLRVKAGSVLITPDKHAGLRDGDVAGDHGGIPSSDKTATALIWLSQP